MVHWRIDVVIVTLVAAIGTGAAALAAWQDQLTRQIPDRYSSVVAISALAGFWVGASTGPYDYRLVPMIGGAMIFGGPWLVAHLVSPRALGFGDVKLSLGLGLHLGWWGRGAPLLAFWATGAIFALVVAGRGRPYGRSVAFGPPLVGGSVLGAILSWALI